MRNRNKDYLVFDALPPGYYGRRCYVGAVRAADRDQLPAHVRHLIRVTATTKKDAISIARQRKLVGCRGSFVPTHI